MKKKECKKLIESQRDKCSCGGRWEIIEQDFDAPYCYLRCNKCKDCFEG